MPNSVVRIHSSSILVLELDSIPASPNLGAFASLHPHANHDSNNIAVYDGSGYAGDSARADGNNGVRFAGDAGGQDHGYDGVDDGGYVQGNGYDGASDGGYMQDHDGASPPGSFGTTGN